LFAWYGRPVDDERRSVVAVASSEAHRSYLDETTVTWGDEPTGQGPAGTCLRTATTQLVEDFASDPDYSPWRDAALGHGFRSGISLPVLTDGELHGALMVYAGEPHAFDDRAVALLEDLAGTLG